MSAEETATIEELWDSFKPDPDSQKEALFLRVIRATHSETFSISALTGGFYSIDKERWPLLIECDGLPRASMSKRLHLDLIFSCYDWACYELAKQGIKKTIGARAFRDALDPLSEEEGTDIFSRLKVLF